MRKQAVSLFSGSLFISFSWIYAVSILLLPLPFHIKLFLSSSSAGIMTLLMQKFSQLAAKEAESGR
ncbi:hypothetical protein CHISP_0631 [Chitinispirillum alkaliphilum]|nr:hypothetical protein CHISP_0631 [Chitinispirillum alkaliphilum]